MSYSRAGGLKSTWSPRMLSFWQRPSSIMLMMTVELDLLFAAQRTSFPVAAHVAMPAHVIMIMTAVTTIMGDATTAMAEAAAAAKLFFASWFRFLNCNTALFRENVWVDSGCQSMA